MPGVELRCQLNVTEGQVEIRYEVYNGGESSVVVMASAENPESPIIEASERPGVVEIGERAWGAAIVEFPKARAATLLRPRDTFRKEISLQRPVERSVPYPDMSGNTPFPDPADAVSFCVGVAYQGDAPRGVLLGDDNTVQHEIRSVLAQRLLCTEPIPF